MAGSIDIDTQIFQLGVHTGGVCRRATLLSEGITDGHIKQRLRSGMLQRVVPGLYAIASLAGPTTPLHVAVLGVPRAVLSHTTAARLYRLPVAASTDVHVTVRNGTRCRLPGITSHQSRTLDSSMITTVDRLPVTSVARTVVDLAGIVSARRIRHVVNTAIRDDMLSVQELASHAATKSRRGQSGMAAVRRVLDELDGKAPNAASVLEQRLGQLLDLNGISGFRSQVRPPWFDGRRGVVDFAHCKLPILLEADGRRWHQREQEMAEDRRRDRLAAMHGWTCIRVTWADLVERPTAVAADIRAVVDLHRRRRSRRLDEAA